LSFLEGVNFFSLLALAAAALFLNPPVLDVPGDMGVLDLNLDIILPFA